MRNTSRAALLTLLALFGTTLAPRVEADDLADEADVQFELGAKKWQAGDYLGALEHFLTSNRLVPNKNVLYNIARCYEQLHRYPDAYRAYGRALEAESAPDKQKDIEAALARIAPKVAILEVETQPPGATVYLERKDLGPRGNTPRKLGLDKGKYKVIVELPGYEPATYDDVEVEVGQAKTIVLKLEPILGTLVLGGDDTGAAVRIDKADGPIACSIPCSTRVVPGKHTLFVTREGYKRSEITVDVGPKQTLTVTPKLDVITGVVVVNADVTNALIEVDGKPYGFTPAVIQVPVGKHAMTVSRSGFKAVTRPIAVSTTSEVRVDATLTEVSEVTAASRTEESVEDAPSSVSIVPSVELRGMGYPTIAEAIRGVRGVYLTNDRAYTTLGFRGFSHLGDYGNRVLVLVDGHPLNDDYAGSAYVGFDARTDIEDVERIEVVRGPGSVLYGTGAFFGVVNLVTRSRGMPDRAEFGVSTAEDAVMRARATATVRLSPDAGAWTSASIARGFGRDFHFPELATPGGFDGWARNSDSFDAGTLAGRAFYKAFTVQWSYHERKKLLPTAGWDTLPGNNDTAFLDRRSFVEARFEPKLGDSAQSFTRAHLNFYDFVGDYAYDPADGGIETEKFHGGWAGLEQRFAFSLEKLLRLTVGGEVIRHARTDLHVSNSNITENYSASTPYTVGAGYLLADVTPSPRIKISAGARLDWYSTVGASLNPRIAVITRPWQDGVAKLLLGKAFRAPSFYEQEYASQTQRKATGLRPENVWSAELEVSHRFTSTVVGTVSSWANRVNDLLVLRGGGTETDQNYYANSDTPVLAYGGDLELRRDFRDGWLLAGNVSLQKTRYLGDDGNEYRKLPNSPEWLGAVRGSIPIITRALVLTSRVSYVGPRWDRYDRTADPEPQQKTDPAVIWDLVFTGEAERTGLRWGVGVYNAFDWRWSAPVSREFRQRSILQNGRTFYASLTVSF